MSRWKVFRYRSEVGWTWAAGEIGNLWRSCYFRTWREAQEYADRLARTREVVLPRQQLPLSLPGLEVDEPIFVTYDIEDGCVYLTDQNNGDMIVLYPHELRPLALTLLAYLEGKEGHA